MAIPFTEVPEPSTMTRVQLESSGDLDQILETFDCYTNPSAPGEAILDVSLLADDDDLTDTAIALFGDESWAQLPAGLVLFHL